MAEEIFVSENVKDRLILAGLKELDKHGVVDFSLRRVAIEAGVSCAAPYRHFKDKDELISAILSYVMEGWTLLSGQIKQIYRDDFVGLISELAVAGLRFFIANGNFRTVITSSPYLLSQKTRGLSDFEEPIIAAISALCEFTKTTDKNEVSFRVLSLLYGSITLVSGGYENFDEAASQLRRAVTCTLEQYGFDS